MKTVRSDLPLLAAIYSGGQTGSDQAGLRAARRLGLATGGYAPKGWRTLEGPAPWLGTEFGLVEDWSPDYAKRTAKNVFYSDATIRIASDFLSPGERCTMRAINKYKKPRIDVSVPIYDAFFDSKIIFADGFDSAELCFVPAAEILYRFLTKHKVKILNIAGNAEQTAPGISKVAEDFLVRALGVS